MARRILVEFLGGDLDGRCFDSSSDDPADQHMVEHCFFLTKEGTVGKAFHGVSMAFVEGLRRGELSEDQLRRVRPTGTHMYKVEERLDEGEETLIRLRYSVRPVDDVAEAC